MIEAMDSSFLRILCFFVAIENGRPEGERHELQAGAFMRLGGRMPPPQAC